MNNQILINQFINTNTIINKLIIAFIGSIILAISAQIIIPLPLVPITMQSLVVLLLGATLGKELGTYTVMLYLLEGLNLPVFAGFSYGMFFLLPTGGFLLSYLPAAYLAGFFAEKFHKKNIFINMLGLAIAHQVIFVIGVLYLSVYLGSLKQAILVGYIPFIGVDAIKFVIVAIYLKSAWKFSTILQKIFH